MSSASIVKFEHISLYSAVINAEFEQINVGWA